MAQESILFSRYAGKPIIVGWLKNLLLGGAAAKTYQNVYYGKI